jgi:hypothetical protein
MSVSLFRKQGEQFLDSNGRPLSGASMYYYRAATQTPQDTYLDQSGSSTNTNPIVLNTSGRLPTPVYIGSNYDYKEVLLDANGVTVSPWPFDNIPKAAVSAPVATGFERLYMPFTQVTAASSPVTLLTANAGYGYEIDASGGNVDLNLPDATSITAGTGYYFKRMDQTASVVSIVPNGTDMIDGANAAIVIPISYSGAYVVSDGSQWLVVYWIFTDAVEGARGLIEIATNAETLAMVNATHAVVPSNLAMTVEQTVYSEYTDALTVTSVVPFDDTKPQISEGVLLLTGTITPKTATNKIEVLFVGNATVGDSDPVVFSLFVNSDADALRSSIIYNSDTSASTLYANGSVVLFEEHEPATTSAVTYTVRVGVDTGGEATVNGNQDGDRKYGGALKCTLRLREIRV